MVKDQEIRKPKKTAARTAPEDGHSDGPPPMGPLGSRKGRRLILPPLVPPPPKTRPKPIPRPPRARVGGPPLPDPGDRREARYALRLHQDLMDELNAMAREQGLRTSQVVERTLIEAANRGHHPPILDAIGRYRYLQPDEPDDE